MCASGHYDLAVQTCEQGWQLAESLRILVFPGAESAEDVEIEVYLGDGRAWELQAVDTLTRPASP